MARRIELNIAELEAKLRVGGSRTPDDVSVTTDGRRLDSKQAVLGWWAEVEVDRSRRRPAQRSADPA